MPAICEMASSQRDTEHVQARSRLARDCVAKACFEVVVPRRRQPQLVCNFLWRQAKPFSRFPNAIAR